MYVTYDAKTRFESIFREKKTGIKCSIRYTEQRGFFAAFLST